MHLRTITFLLLNGCGIAAYLFLASWTWIEPSLADMPGASDGAAFVWAFGAARVPCICFLIDVVWMALELNSPERAPRGFGLALLLVPVLWVVAIYVDFSRHGI